MNANDYRESGFVDMRAYLAQFGADDPAPTQIREHTRVLELEAALQDIANANGEESFVMSSRQYIDGFQQGTAAQGERAKKALGLAYKEQPPANLLLEMVERYRETLQAIIDTDTASTYQGDNEFFTGVSVAETTLKDIARKALGR